MFREKSAKSDEHGDFPSYLYGVTSRTALEPCVARSLSVVPTFADAGRVASPHITNSQLRTNHEDELYNLQIVFLYSVVCEY